MKTFRFWTGPVGVEHYANLLAEAGFSGVFAGTEYVYFKSVESREALQLQVSHGADGVFPCAGFKVERA